MKEIDDSQHSYLEVRKAEINFIYSCIPTYKGVNISFKGLFGPKLPNERLDFAYDGYTLSEKEEELQKLGKHRADHNLIDELKAFDQLKYKRYRPQCRKGISQYLTLDLDMGFIRPQINLENCWLEYNDDKYPDTEVFESHKTVFTHPNESIRLTIRPLIRYFASGMSVSFKITIKHKEGLNFNEHELYKVLHLVGMNQNCPSNYIICFKHSDMVSDYDLFSNEEHINKYFSRHDGIIKITLYNLFKLINQRCILEPLKTRFRASEKSSVKMLCSSFTIKQDNDELNLFQEPEAQSPWVVSSIELSEGCYSEFSSCYEDSKMQVLGTEKAKKLKKYVNSITPLLFRGPDLNLLDFKFDATYYHYSEWESDYLSNYSIHFDNRLFVQMSRRSILTITREDGIKKHYPGKYFIPSLLDICEIVRVRWQTLVILNYISDLHIRAIKTGDYFEETNDLVSSSGIEQIINQIYLLSTCLDSVSSYVVSGDALREIQERMNDTFRLEELSRLVLKKAEILEKLRSLTMRKKALDVEF